MKSEKNEPRFSVRPTADELARLQKLAQANGKSLNRFLIERGLATTEAHLAVDSREHELRERAVFELRRAGYNLHRITERSSRTTSNVSIEQIECAIKEITAATQMLDASFGKEHEG